MSLRRKLLAYGLVGVVSAGLAWLWMLANERRAERSVTSKHPDDPWGM